MKRIAAFIFGMLIAAYPVFALALSPTRVGTDVTQDFASGSLTNDVTITVPSTGQNRALICIAMQLGGLAVPTGLVLDPTGANQAMTQLTNVTGSQQINGNSWYLANPTAGTNLTMRATWGTTAGARTIICMTYQDMVQSSPMDASAANPAHQTSGSSSHPTVDITTNTDNDIVISWVCIGSSPATLTADSPQSQIATKGGTIGSDCWNLASDQPLASHGTQTQGFTASGASSEDMYAIALKYLAPTPVVVNNANAETWVF